LPDAKDLSDWMTLTLLMPVIIDDWIFSFEEDITIIDFSEQPE
jgi:hypothetical protein